MFLLFGASRAVLLDTGATANPEYFPLRATVDSIISAWLAGHRHDDDYGLLVLHTHSHGDHTAADGQFTVRLADWCSQHPVSHVLGCHIEMSATPGQDYPICWTYQPDEPPLQLTPGHVWQLQDTILSHDLKPSRYVLPEMIIYPVG